MPQRFTPGLNEDFRVHSIVSPEGDASACIASKADAVTPPQRIFFASGFVEAEVLSSALHA